MGFLTNVRTEIDNYKRSPYAEDRLLNLEKRLIKQAEIIDRELEKLHLDQKKLEEEKAMLPSRAQNTGAIDKSSLYNPYKQLKRRTGGKKRGHTMVNPRLSIFKAILVLLANGFREEDISKALNISKANITYYKRVMVSEMKARNSVHMVFIAIKKGILNLDSDFF